MTILYYVCYSVTQHIKTHHLTLLFLNLNVQIWSFQDFMLVILIENPFNAWNRIQHHSWQRDHPSHEDKAGVIALVVIKQNSWINYNWHIMFYCHFQKSSPTIGGPISVATPWNRSRRPKALVNLSAPRRSAKTKVVSRTYAALRVICERWVVKWEVN